MSDDSKIMCKCGWIGTQKGLKFNCCPACRAKFDAFPPNQTSGQAERSIKHGNKYPYDGQDDWWEGDGDKPPALKHKSWHHKAARGILADLTDRRDIKTGFANVDEDIRQEIVQTLSDIIETAERLHR